MKRIQATASKLNPLPATTLAQKSHGRQEKTGFDRWCYYFLHTWIRRYVLMVGDIENADLCAIRACFMVREVRAGRPVTCEQGALSDRPSDGEHSLRTRGTHQSRLPSCRRNFSVPRRPIGIWGCNINSKGDCKGSTGVLAIRTSPRRWRGGGEMPPPTIEVACSRSAKGRL